MTETNPDYILIGAGIMSATLGTFIKSLEPKATIHIYERLNKVGAESSSAWNNAGTGHSAFCELNYTPYLKDGSVDLTKALRISEQFEISKQFWSYLKENKLSNSKNPFINDIPHMSFVWGAKNIDFLNARYNSMTKYTIFEDMVITKDKAQIQEWIPLMMNGRDKKEALAVTRMDIGTDVNFGEITRNMIRFLEDSDGVSLELGTEVEDLTHKEDGSWAVDIKNLITGKSSTVTTKFVFIGAGGGALPLLEKSDIPEGRGYGGFPVSGQWLRCDDEKVITQHEAKVYGKAAKGSPPMSVPHLDTRYLDGKRSLLFGPYAGFSTKFLKEGSWMDLPFSIEMHNIWPMLSAGMHNIDLTKYLIQQVMQSKEGKFEFLQKFYPEAELSDWRLEIAGQRVQIIKKDKKVGGVLKFGTEIVSAADGSLACLLGASPGASTSVSIMLDVLNICFPDKVKSPGWQATIKKMIPSYGQSLIKDGALLKQTRERTTRILSLSPNQTV